MNKIDKALVEEIKWEDDPDRFDQRLHDLNDDHDSFIVVNPKFDPWILDYIDTDDIDDRRCVVWAIDNFWLIKKFTKGWQPTDGWNLIHCELELDTEIAFNSEINFKSYDVEFKIDIENFDYEHVWYIDPEVANADNKIWAVTLKAKDFPIVGIKDKGFIKPSYEFDVIFISYNEPNAESNWQRVLEKYPRAKRVKNVKGIFEAHQAAAKLATTEMFYVVDGDAELIDNWKFDYQPDMFSMDCVHLWTSINPINDLEYGWGGVKLFPRQLLLDATTWKVDLTTGLGKLVYLNKISNINRFNTDGFNTWRSAFRECAKLNAKIKQNLGFNTTKELQEATTRLDIWNTQGQDRNFGQFALDGARSGTDYGARYFNELDKLKLINDYDWMRNEFTEFYKQQ